MKKEMPATAVCLAVAILFAFLILSAKAIAVPFCQITWAQSVSIAYGVLIGTFLFGSRPTT